MAETYITTYKELQTVIKTKGCIVMTYILSSDSYLKINKTAWLKDYNTYHMGVKGTIKDYDGNDTEYHLAGNILYV